MSTFKKHLSAMRLLLLALPALIFQQTLHAQSITGKVTGKTAHTIDLLFCAGRLDTIVEENTISIPVNSNGEFSYKGNANYPQIAYTSIDGGLWINTLFLSPSDELYITFHLTDSAAKSTITGKGSANNQLPPAFMEANTAQFYGDTTPNRVLQYLFTEKTKKQAFLQSYIQQHHPDKTFTAHLAMELTYFAPYQYFSFYENNKFGIREAFKRNRQAWQNPMDSLFRLAPLQNDAAVNTSSYRLLIKEFLLRKKEQLWREQAENREAFFKEWFGVTKAAGDSLMKNDVENNIRLKIIQRYFKGASQEYALAVLIRSACSDDLLQNLDKVHSAFLQSFPHSPYRKWIDPLVAQKLRQYELPLNSQMVLIDSTANRFDSLAQVLAFFKGKTVLMDMWGTWCGPCRNEIRKNAASLEEHFKNRQDVAFLYIANRDMDNQEKWKKLIAYYQLNGFHILAGNNLTQNIMRTVKGQGFPTYVVIDKTGQYERIEEYPMDRDKVIRLIESKL